MSRITDAVAKQAKARPTRYDIRDKDGLVLRVHPTGSRVWQHVFDFEGRRHRVRLGEYPNTSVTAARKAHAEQRDWLKEGLNPAEIEAQKKREKAKQAREERQAPTVEDLADEYLEQYAKRRKRSWAADERMLRGYLLPVLGDVKAKDVSRRDVVLLLDAVRDHGKPDAQGRFSEDRPPAPVQANRLLAVVRRMFGFAVGRDILPGSPVTQIQAPAKETPRTRVLSEDELREFWTTLAEAPASEPVRIALRLVLLTGQRNTEVREMTWSELDGEWWTIPASRTKNGLIHRVPLTPSAVELLERAKELAVASEWVFPSPYRARRGKTDSRPLSQLALTRALSRAGFGFTAHDLRRTVGTELGRLGFNRLIQDKILNHKDRTVGGIYDLYSYDIEKRKALEAWERRVLSVASGSGSARDIVPLLRRAGE